MVFTNKHVVIAVIVAPILAVLAWLAVGQFAGEEPQAALPGQSYPLVEKSNCRYPSGACDLANEEFRLRLSAASQGSSELLLSSSHPLDGVVMGVSLPEEEVTPVAMRSLDGRGLEWSLELDSAPEATQIIRVVALAGGSSYFAEAHSAFLQPQEN
jgi:hypothetical protein